MKALFILLILSLPFQAMARGSYLNPSTELSGKQREYYIKTFNYAMNNVKDEKPYQWKVGTAKGEIRIGKEYISKSKSLCRNFTETFVIDDQTGTSEGAACKRDGNNGWCRLKNTDAHTCALEEPEGTFEKFTNDAEGTLDKGNEIIRNTKDWWNR